MTNNRYGGRYSTNYIEDIKPPVKHVAVQEDRSGLTNFRPFEEIAHNIPLARHIPRTLHKKVWIDYSSSASPISVQVLRSPVLAGYTYVPPLTSREFDWQHGATAYYDTFIRSLHDMARTGFEGFKRFGEWIGSHITVPVMTGVSATVGLAFGTSYTIDQGVQRRWKTGIRAYALASILALLVIVGAFLLLNSLLGQPAQSTNRTATSSAHIVQQPAAGSTTQKNNSSPTPNAQSSAPTNGSAPSSAVNSSGSAGVGSTILNSGTAGATGGSIPAVGGYGGGAGTTSIPSSVSPTTPSTSTGTGSLPNPATLIPYTSTTTPNINVSNGGKQVLNASGTTLTTN